VNVIGLRKERVGDSKPKVYDIENFAITTSYNQIDHRDFEIEEALSQNVRVGATYDYSFEPFTIEPFKNIAVLDSSEYFLPVKDLNINPLPTNITLIPIFSANIMNRNSVRSRLAMMILVFQHCINAIICLTGTTG
jgi:cell surface protein SprA